MKRQGPGRLVRAMAVLACASGVAAAAAVAAPGFVPQRAAQLQVIAFGSHESVDASFSPRVAAPARLTFYVPQGYGLSLTAAPGTAVGLANAEVLTDSSAASPDFVFGDLAVGNPALGTDAVAQACSPGGHAAVWVTTLQSEPPAEAGLALQTRVYVDPTSGSDAALGAYRLVVCLPSPFVAAAQGGAPLGAQFTDVGLDLFLANRPAAGTFTWRLLTTPYQYGTGSPDESSTFETRARVIEPSALTLKAGYQTTTGTLVVSGRLVAGGQPRPGVKVDIFLDKKDPLWLVFNVWTARTRADGTFSLRERIPQAAVPQELSVDANVGAVPGPCVQPPVVAGGCVDESLSPPADPKTVAVTIPKRQR